MSLRHESAEQSGPQASLLQRENDSWLAESERLVLRAMARRLPAWVTPNMLTALALGGSALACAGYVLSASALPWIHLSSLGLVVHWWGDSLDGTLARVRGIQRVRFGYYIDHQADAVSTVVLCCGLALGGLMTVPVALLLAVAILLLMNHVNLVAASRGMFRISFARLGPTEGRLALIAANTLVWLLGNPEIAVWVFNASAFTILGAAGVVALLAIYAFGAVREARLIGRLDPGPTPEDDRLSPPPRLK